MDSVEAGRDFANRNELRRMGRQELLDWIGHLEAEIKKTEERAVARVLLLEKELEELRAARGIVLPGWFCPSCKVFNGEEKERRERCRSCDAPKAVSGPLSSSRTPSPGSSSSTPS